MTNITDRRCIVETGRASVSSSAWKRKIKLKGIRFETGARPVSTVQRQYVTINTDTVKGGMRKAYGLRRVHDPSLQYNANT